MRPAAARSVAVVVTHFADQRRLDLVLGALELQTLSADAFEVIIADDGSATAPQVGSRAYPARVVTHADLGNRAGPARNLGARASTAPTLVFLDGDTVPEPAFLDEIVQACDGQRLTVGRRRHADLSTIDVAGVAHWLTGTGPAPPVLDEPAWLTEGWARSDDLRQTDLRSYRYVISAVLACPRWLFDRAGGFAEELVGYGGEDWEFARRCWLAGADFRHAPDAIGWHDGPDLGGRPEDVVAVKNAETMRIAALLTDPALRGRGLIWPNPRVVARYRLDASVPEAAWLASIESLLCHGDVGVWVGDAPLPPVPDPRIQRGLPGGSVLGRCELVLDVTAAVRFDDALVEALQTDTPVRAGGVSAASPRHLALATPAVDIDSAPTFDRGVQLERWFESRATRSALRCEAGRADRCGGAVVGALAVLVGAVAGGRSPDDEHDRADDRDEDEQVPPSAATDVVQAADAHREPGEEQRQRRDPVRDHAADREAHGVGHDADEEREKSGTPGRRRGRSLSSEQRRDHLDRTAECEGRPEHRPSGRSDIRPRSLPLRKVRAAKHHRQTEHQGRGS